MDGINGVSASVAGPLLSKALDRGEKVKDAVSLPSVGSDSVVLSGSAVTPGSRFQGLTNAKGYFDPTATGGPFEQRFIDGNLATSSAKDGYNGWEAMLRDHFSIDNGGDRNDMPVRRYGAYDLNRNGRVSGEILTREERNLIANMYVYAHDNGIPESEVRAIAGSIHILRTSTSLTNWGSIKFVYHDQEKLYGTGALGPGGRYMEGLYSEDTEAVAQRIISSNAFQDTLIPKETIRDILNPHRGGALHGVSKLESLERFVYAYSKGGSDGSANPNALQTQDMQERLAYNAREKARIAKLEETRKQGISDREALARMFGIQRAENAEVSNRLGTVAESLSEGQKSLLSMLYGEADKQGAAAVSKVNALAKAFATLNFTTAFFNTTANTATDPASLLGAIQLRGIGAPLTNGGPLIMPTGSLNAQARQLVIMANYLHAHGGAPVSPTIDKQS